MYKIIYPLILVVLFCMPSFVQAQSLKAYQKAAVKAEQRMDYSEALANYEVIINEAGKETTENFYRAAENARLLRVYPVAERYYQQILSSDDAGSYPLTNYWLGHVKKRMGKYNEAIFHFNNYLSGSGASGGVYSEMAQKEIEDSRWAATRTLEKDPVQITHLDDKVNSPYTDMAPVLYNDKLYFTSLRENLSSGFGVCESPVTRLYTADKAGDIMAANTLDFNQGGTNVAHTAFGNNGNHLFYSVCDSRNTNKDSTNCQIYYRKLRSDSTWGNAIALPEHINMNGYNTTQPSIGVDKTNNRETLYFASNRPGGKGKMDIWYSNIDENGDFSDPANLSALNTMEDEISPFYDSENQALFFSSEGHRNLGGFDIYRAAMTANGFDAFTHMGYPLNTGSDEIYFSTNSQAGKSYFVSNRPGGMCVDTSQYCVCNDIYEVDNPALEVRVLTFNEITGEPLFGTEVTLSSLNNTDLEAQIKSLADNNLYDDYQVDFSDQYEVVATKEKYTMGKVAFGTPGPFVDTIIEAKVYLRPAVDLTVNTFDRGSGDPLNGVEVRLVELNEDELLSTEVEAFGNEYDYDIDWKKRYMIIASREGYTPDTTYVSTEGIPAIPTSFSENLFLCRNISGFNDVVLYFDNDQPEPDNMRTETNINYRTAYQDYINDFQQKKGYYKSSSARTPEMENFFAQDVQNGFNNLEALAAKMLDYFEEVEGDAKIEVTIRGFASLRSNPEYNKALTKRRISSIENYFNNWVASSGKTLRDFKERIVVTESPLGDENACQGCYNKSAITDVSAAKDRRVEVINVTITKNPCQKK